MKEMRNKNVKSVFGGIGIASLLCVLMVLMSWSAMVTNSDINSETSDSVESQEVKPGWLRAVGFSISRAADISNERQAHRATYVRRRDATRRQNSNIIGTLGSLGSTTQEVALRVSMKLVQCPCPRGQSWIIRCNARAKRSHATFWRLFRVWPPTQSRVLASTYARAPSLPS